MTTHTELAVGLTTSSIYAHIFADKSVYIGASKYLGKRDSDFTPRNTKYAEKLAEFGNPTISIIDTFDTSDGNYEIVFESEREMYLLLKDMGVEMLNERTPIGKVSGFWGNEMQIKSNLKRVEDGTHNFLGGEQSRKNALQKVADGTHLFLGGEVARKTSLKRIADGTHNFLDGRNNRKVISLIDGRITSYASSGYWNKKNPSYIGTWIDL